MRWRPEGAGERMNRLIGCQHSSKYRAAVFTLPKLANVCMAGCDVIAATHWWLRWGSSWFLFFGVVDFFVPGSAICAEEIVACSASCISVMWNSEHAHSDEANRLPSFTSSLNPEP